MTMGQMIGMALLASVAAPLLLIALLRLRPGADRVLPPAAVALPVFLVAHGAALVVETHLGGAAGVALPTSLLLLGGLLFWAPVVGQRRRLPQPARFCYLFLALPLLDLPAAYLVTVGKGDAAVAMLVGMAPIGAVAVFDTWRWITAEERAAGQVPA